MSFDEEKNGKHSEDGIFQEAEVKESKKNSHDSDRRQNTKMDGEDEADLVVFKNQK